MPYAARKCRPIVLVTLNHWWLIVLLLLSFRALRLLTWGCVFGSYTECNKYATMTLHVLMYGIVTFNPPAWVFPWSDDICHLFCVAYKLHHRLSFLQSFHLVPILLYIWRPPWCVCLVEYVLMDIIVLLLVGEILAPYLKAVICFWIEVEEVSDSWCLGCSVHGNSVVVIQLEAPFLQYIIHQPPEQ